MNKHAAIARSVLVSLANRQRATVILGWHVVTHFFVGAGLTPMLGVPLAGGGTGTESLLAQAVEAAAARRLVSPGSHVVAVMSYRGDLVLQARPAGKP